ncbi:hypothetical protein MXB_371 [Myxobolus squamalis]|nr:hypothetical protein MXB_371 [Myxobolus squamalis]
MAWLKSICFYALVIIFEVLALMSCAALIYSFIAPILFILKPLQIVDIKFRAGVFKYTLGSLSSKINNPEDSYIALQSFIVITTILACLTSILVIFQFCVQSLKILTSVIFASLYTYEYKKILGNFFYIYVKDQRSFSFDVSVVTYFVVSKETLPIPLFLYASYVICLVFISLFVCLCLKKNKKN